MTDKIISKLYTVCARTHTSCTLYSHVKGANWCHTAFSWCARPFSEENFNKCTEGHTCCFCREQCGENQMPQLGCGTLCSVLVSLAEHWAKSDDLAAPCQISWLGNWHSFLEKRFSDWWNCKITNINRMCWCLSSSTVVWCCCSNHYMHALNYRVRCFFRLFVHHITYKLASLSIK